jgi:hypothetical protein
VSGDGEAGGGVSEGGSNPYLLHYDTCIYFFVNQKMRMQSFTIDKLLMQSVSYNEFM